MMTLHLKYLLNEQGGQEAVVIPIEEWKLIERQITTELSTENNETSASDDLDLLEVYVKLKPQESFMVKGKITSIKKGELRIFPIEFDGDLG